MRAIITVVGQDTVGILAAVLVNIDHLSGGINGLSQSMNELGKEKNLKIHVMHEDIFHSMHRI